MSSRTENGPVRELTVRHVQGLIVGYAIMGDRATVICADTSDRRSLTELLYGVAHDLVRMVEAEVRLAHTELRKQAQKTGRAVRPFGGAAVIGVLAGASFITCCIAVFALVMPLWLAALIMGVLFGIGAAVVFRAGRLLMKQTDFAPRAADQAGSKI